MSEEETLERLKKSPLESLKSGKNRTGVGIQLSDRAATPTIQTSDPRLEPEGDRGSDAA